MIEGIYLDGKTSKRVKARLEVLYDSHHAVSLHIHHDDEVPEKIRLGYKNLTIETRLGNTPREINFGEGQLFISENNNAIDDLIKKHNTSKWPELLHKLESNLPLICLATATTLAIIWSTITFGIPKSAEYIAYQLPKFASDKLGSGLAILDKTVFDPSTLDESRQQHIQKLLKPYLILHQDLNPKFVFRSGMKANALALPDGHIVFTDDFVNLIDDDNELVAVLFHELGHLKYKHMLRRALQDSMITLMVIFITGDVDSIDLLTGLPTLILDLSYSREFESEADKFALEQLHAVGMDVSAFASAMENLDNYYASAGGKDEVINTAENLEIEAESNSELNISFKTVKKYLSTHPATQDRVQMVAEFKQLHALED